MGNSLLWQQMADIGFWNYSFLVTGAEVLFLTLLALYIRYRKVEGKGIYAAGVAVFFHVIVLLLAYNAPVTDDNYALLQWGTKVLPTKGISNIIATSFEPYNECRIVFARWLTTADYYLFGSIDFRHLMLIGISGLWVILWLFIRKSGLPALVVALLLFQFQYYDSIFWANCALQNIWSIAFCMLALMLITKDAWYWKMLSVPAAIIATYTYGSGMLVFPVLLLYLLWKKQYVYSIGILIVAVCTGILYLTGLSAAHPKTDLFAAILHAIPFTIVFLGSPFQFLYNIALPLIIGIGIIICAGWMLVSGYYRKNPFIVMVLLYILVCAFTAGVFRGMRGMQEGLSMRYGIYAIVAIICCIAFLVDTIKNKRVIPITIGCALLFHFAANFFFFPEVPTRNTLLKRYMLSIPDAGAAWHQSPVIPLEGRQIVTTAIEKGIYTNPETE